MKRGHRSAGEVDVEVKGKNCPLPRRFATR